MPRTSARVTIARGIYRDASGYAIQVCVRGHREERRFPLGTPMRDLEAEREAMRERLSRIAAKTTGGTLAADSRDYLLAVRSMPSYPSRRRIIDLWNEILGDQIRADITPGAIRAAMSVFQRQYSPQYCRHILRALQHLYTVLDGRGAANPAREVPLPAVPPPLPRDIPLLAVVAILRQLRRRSKTRARLAVIATTGMAHVELKKLRPQDVDWTRGTVLVQGRRKGAGTRGRLLPLTKHSRLALRAFARVNAWGAFSNSSMHSRFREACKAAGYGHTDWRPYDLRHTLATALARQTQDERVVQAWLGHTSQITTHRYTLGSVPARLVAAASVMDGYRNGAVKQASGTGSKSRRQIA